MAFPSAPSAGDTFTAPSGAVYQYTAYGAWKVKAPQTDFTLLTPTDKAALAADLQYGGSPIWHTGNDGAGSGLDADLLDGNDSTYYADIVSRLGYTPFNSAHLPAGTVAVFQQTAAPVGWTKGATHDNKALRVVSGTAASGGTTAFTTVFTARTIAQANLPNVNLTGASNGDHQHLLVKNVITGATTLTNANFLAFERSAATSFDYALTGDTGTPDIGLSSTAGAHTHNVPLGGSGTAMDFAVQYMDVIVAAKN